MGAKAKTRKGDADKLAFDTIKELGFDTWELDSCSYYNFEDYTGNVDLANKEIEQNEAFDFYSYIFVPKYNELSSFHVPLLSVKSDDQYAANYYYQKIQIDIVDNEIIYADWYSPLEITEETALSSPLLGFDQAYDRFKEFAQTKYTVETALNASGQLENRENIYVDIEVKQLDFKMMRIKERDSDMFLLVPVWIFSGDIYNDENLLYLNKQLAIINALDGTIIDAEIGY